MQILRAHWRTLMPWDRSADNHLSLGQRLDYLVGGLQWLNDLVYLGFTIVLTVVAGLLLSGSTVAIRPLIGPTILLPAMLLIVGLLRAIWALRRRTHISYARAVLAFANWLSLSWTVALACIQGLTRREGVFLRTPKSEEDHHLRATVAAARTEIALWVILWGLAGWAAARTSATPLLVGLLAWQGMVYASSPLMSWLDQRGHLPPELERRRRSERRRERIVAIARPMAYTSLGALAATMVGFVVVLALGASHPGAPSNPFNVAKPPPGDRGPFGLVSHANPPSTTTTSSTKPHASTTTTSSTTTPTKPTSTTTTSSTTTTTTTTTTSTTTTTLPPPAG